MSIYKLIKDLNCKVTFFSTHCIFQDQTTGRMIGHVKERDELYYLKRSSEKLKNVYQSSLSFQIEYSISNKEQIWFHHFRLGHPSFSVLRTMFPLLFKSIDVDSFHCNACEFAKHCCVSFLLSNKRCSIPFTLVYCDIWNPSRVLNVSKARWLVSFMIIAQECLGFSS